MAQARKKVLLEASHQLLRELDQIGNRTHPEYLRLGAVINATRLRLLSMAELEYQLSVQHAKHNLDFAKQQIENDYQVGLEDVREKLYADLRRRKREIREMAEAISPYLPENDPLVLPDMKIPVRKRRGERALRGRKPEERFNLKALPMDTKQDRTLIRSVLDQKA